MNKELQKAIIKFLKISERFNGPPFLTFVKNVCPNGTCLLYIFYLLFQFKNIFTELTLGDT